MANTLQLKVFVTGRVAVETDGAVIDEAHLGGRQARLLFAYLVAERNRPVPRDELAEALWGETPPVTRDKGLTVIASKLRAALGDAGLDGRELLTAAFGCYRLDLPEGTWVDLFAAVSSAQEAEEALAAGDLDQARAAAESAESLLRRPFLPGEDGTWVEQKRRDLADIRERALSVLADACLRSGAAGEAAKWAEELIALSPFRDDGYRRLMEAHVVAGNRAEALRVYEQCRRLLADELGAYPSPETESIYRALLEAPQPSARATPPVVEPSVEPGEPELSRVHTEALPLQAEQVVERRSRKRRAVLLSALTGVIAAAVAVPLFAFSSGGSRATQLDGALGGNAVGAVSASTGHIFAAIPLSASPDAIAAGAGSIWAAMSDRGVVSRIDQATNTVQQTISTPGGPSALTVGGGFVWVADTLARTVARIDPRANGGKVVGKPIRVGNGPSGIAYGLGAVWVANSIDRTVIRIDPVTGTPGRPISVEDGADGDRRGRRQRLGDRAVGRGSLAHRSGVAARWSARLTSATSPPPSRSAPTPCGWQTGRTGRCRRSIRRVGTWKVSSRSANSRVASPSQRTAHVWVANAGSATLTELDPATGRVVRTVPTGALPGGVALDGDTVYVAAQVPPSAHRGGTLTLAIANLPGVYEQPIPKSLDPASGYSAWELLTLTNDGLLGYSQAGGAETYKVVPDLATGLPTVSDGGLTYTFQLRKGIRYSTGGVVQPADIRRGIERALLQSRGQGPGSYLAVIEGGGGCVTGEHCDLTRGITTSPGSSTVTFHLSRPDPDFRFQLALPEYDAVPASTPLHARLPLPATGPYEISGYQTKGVVELVRNPRFRVWSAAAQPDGYPDRIVERYRYSGRVRDPRGRARRRRHHGGRSRSDLAARARGVASDALLEPAVRGAELSDPRALAEHEARAVQRRPRPAGVQPRRRPQPARPDQRRHHRRRGGDVPVPAAERERLQRLLPLQLGRAHYPPDLAKARRLVAESGTKGQPVTIWLYDVTFGHRLRRLPGLGAAKPRLQGPARVRSAHRADLARRPPGRRRRLGRRLPVRQRRLLAVPLQLLHDQPGHERNPAGDLRPAAGRAGRSCAVRSRRPTPPRRPALWHSIDRLLTDEAPWVPMTVTLSTDFVGRRVGNYRYCWLSGGSGMTGACLDQLWVR